jgi:hypothetical protein
MVDRGLSERRSLAVVGMSASAYRYETRPDRNAELRQRILALAQRHKRYGVGMIHLKLRQAGLIVNYKRVERAVSGSGAAGASAQAQEGADGRAAASGSAGDAQRGVVNRFRV